MKTSKTKEVKKSVRIQKDKKKSPPVQKKPKWGPDCEVEISEKGKDRARKAGVVYARPTPGPWYVNTHPYQDQPEYVLAKRGWTDDDSSDTVSIATVERLKNLHTGWRTKEECEANARLIAAAPEMLSALINIAGSATVVQRGTPESIHAWFIRLNKDVVELIAKIEGTIL